MAGTDSVFMNHNHCCLMLPHIVPSMFSPIGMFHNCRCDLWDIFLWFDWLGGLGAFHVLRSWILKYCSCTMSIDVHCGLLTKLSSPVIRELCHDFAAIKDNLAVGSTWIQDLMKFWSGCMLHWLDWALCRTKANPQRRDWNEIHWSPITCSLTSSNATAPMFQ